MVRICEMFALKQVCIIDNLRHAPTTPFKARCCKQTYANLLNGSDVCTKLGKIMKGEIV
jgi:hypothetical protein